MVRGILQQVVHHPTAYTAEMAMRQVAFHMLKNPNRFYKFYEEHLLRAGESYESYVVNVFHAKVWGDDLIAGAFGDMWNVAVSVVSPVAKKPFHLFHNKTDPDVVLVCNGGNYLSAGGSTHYSGTRSTDVHFKKPGSDTMNPTLKQDLTGILMPVLLKRKDFAKQKALDEYVKDEKQATLDMLRTVSKGIRRIDDRIATLVEQSDEFIKQKKFLEFKMEKLGIHAEQIQEYTDDMIDRPWCRTTEREMEDEEEANRKRQLEEQKEESEAKKQRIMPTVEGHENPDFLSPSKRTEDSEHDELLKKQQQEILRGHEVTIQKQEQALFAQERTIRFQKEMLDKLQEQVRSLCLQQGGTRAQQTVSRAEEVDCSSLNIAQSEPTSNLVQPGPSTQKQYKRGGTATIDKMLRPELMRFLPSQHSQPAVQTNVQEDDIIIAENIPGFTTSRTDVPVLPSDLTISQEQQAALPPPLPPKLYVPKITEGQEGQSLVLMPTKMKKSTKLRESTRPVPEELQDDDLFYCDNCEAKYTTKDELNRHVANVCGVKKPEYFCDECPSSFYWLNPLREHYYKMHVKKFLYRCTKCGKGIHYKSRMPDHNRKCPKKDGEDKYVGKLPYDEEIESKFVKRKAVPVVLDQPENEQQQLQQQQQQQDQQQQIQQQQIQQQQIQDQPQQQQIQDQPQQQQIQEQQDQQLQEQQDQQLQLEMTSQEPILIQEEKPIQEQQLQLEMTSQEPILIQEQKPILSILELAPTEQTTSTETSTPVPDSSATEDQIAVHNILPLAYQAQPTSADELLNTLSEGRVPNIADEIPSADNDDNDNDDDDKKMVLTQENKFDE